MERQAVMGPASRAFKMKLSFKHYFLMGDNSPSLDSVLHEQKNIRESCFRSIAPRDPIVAKEKDKARSTVTSKMMDGILRSALDVSWAFRLAAAASTLGRRRRRKRGAVRVIVRRERRRSAPPSRRSRRRRSAPRRRRKSGAR